MSKFKHLISQDTIILSCNLSCCNFLNPPTRLAKFTHKLTNTIAHARARAKFLAAHPVSRRVWPATAPATSARHLAVLQKIQGRGKTWGDTFTNTMEHHMHHSTINTCEAQASGVLQSADDCAHLMGMPVQQMSKQFPEDGKALINSHIGPSKGCQEGRVAQSVIHGLWQSESSLGPGLAFPSGGHPQHEQQRGEHIEAASQAMGQWEVKGSDVEGSDIPIWQTLCLEQATDSPAQAFCAPTHHPEGPGK
eukprot:829595-Pelagomonas_calceolata.AAC.1